MSPLSNAYLKPAQLQQMEPFYPLHAYVCEQCYLVQLQEFESPANIFSDYAYFSSYSESWLKHAKAYTEYMIERFGFNNTSQIVEIASNDGYLLQYFKDKNIPVLGVEPAQNVATVAQAAGIPTVTKFFGVKTATELANEGKTADLLLGNNVLAHVPDINDFVGGLKKLLKPHGVITMEFPHLLRLMEQNQFDTIYHEHFSYLSFITVEKIFAKQGLSLFDVAELTTHGGSLRIFARHTEDDTKPLTERVDNLRQLEKQTGLDDIKTYQIFAEKVRETKRKILDFLIPIKQAGKTIVGYGAPAKGNTLLNYCGIRTDFIDYTVDRSPHKQDLFLPGTHIAIHHPDKIKPTKPDYVLILPWNLKDEIIEQMAYIREWGGQFVVLIPEIGVI
ncbi:NDP-hexose 3-C-methyltransferase protein [Candidatus Thiomargarita nelsonii]|uniref:NDP-hexose 3-C-methyltransferase protein n=1 Tax=Candidatus Thiomargarita nelsonii TaxID=1003181 RepID=A0A176S1I1_9GAMM|nr:NDP-hexose 3-C-methyltransferase protein [Candidatus Thiomargarita nelsonii]